MNNIKEAALDTISRLPEEVTWDDIFHELYVKEKIEEGLRDAREGRIVTHEDMRKQFLK